MVTKIGWVPKMFVLFIINIVIDSFSYAFPQNIECFLFAYFTTHYWKTLSNIPLEEKSVDKVCQESHKKKDYDLLRLSHKKKDYALV